MSNSVSSHQTTCSGLGHSLTNRTVTAITLFGDPYYILGQPIDAGNSTAAVGRVPRPANQTTQLATYSSTLRSWCESGDYFCDNAANMTSGIAVHLQEVQTWQNDALAFLVPKFQGHSDF